KLPHACERMPEQEPRTVDRPEQVADHREPAAADPLGEDRRSAGIEHPPMNLGRLQPRIDLVRNPDQLPGPLEVVDGFAKAAVHVLASRLTGPPIFSKPKLRA